MEKEIFTIERINSYISNMFTQDFLLRSVYVKGEVSGVKYHSSGHIYFTLKDETGILSAVMFAGKRRTGLKFRLEDGQKVICGGRIGAYPSKSQYEMFADTISLDGEGDLYLQYEKLKKELEEMGMFSEQYKKPIPKYAEKIGIVTASTGEAIHDIITTAKGRNPYVQLYLYPVTVQGANAAESIVEGIRFMDCFGVDVMIVGRGGGSVEDLFVFNDRRIAEAIFACNTPVVSAVGHEPDYFISDFVADLRAATPTASAVATVYKIDDFDRQLAEYGEAFRSIVEQKITRERLRLERQKAAVDKLNPLVSLNNKRLRLLHHGERLEDMMMNILNEKKHTYALLLEQMRGISPLEKLDKGYAYAENKGKPLKSVEGVKKDDSITLFLKDGKVITKVTEVTKGDT